MPTKIPFNFSYMRQLLSLVHAEEVLQSSGYKRSAFSMGELKRLRRCRNCHARLHKAPLGSKKEPEKAIGVHEFELSTARPARSIIPYEELRSTPNKIQQTQPSIKPDPGPFPNNRDIGSEPKSLALDPVPIGKKLVENHAEQRAELKKQRCTFHPGDVEKMYYKCCGKHVSEEGCVSKEQHEPQDHRSREFERYWLLHPTPKKSVEIIPNISGSSQSHRKAVALDCETGASVNGGRELIRLSLIDYFTCETLIDSLVFPHVKMIQYNRRWSGVTRGMMMDARRKGLCIDGINAARANVWKFVGPDTVVVMHGGSSHMVSLRWIHEHIIDTFILEQSKKESLKGSSLKHLASELLGRDIQRGAHASLEDALACRDLVARYLNHRDVLD